MSEIDTDTDADTISRLAHELSKCWNAQGLDDGDAFSEIAQTILSNRQMDDVLDAVLEIVDDSIPVFEAIRDMAAVSVGRGTIDGAGYFFRTDLFGIPLAGKRSDIKALFSGAFPHQIESEMKAAGYIAPSARVLVYAAPIAPARAAFLGADTLRYLSETAMLTLTGQDPDAARAWDVIANANKLQAEIDGRDADCPEIFLLLGARLLQTKEGGRIVADHLAPDLAYDEEGIEDAIAAAMAEMEASLGLLLERRGAPEVDASVPSSFSGALSECASLHFEEWLEYEAEIRGIPIPEEGFESIHVAQEGQDYIVSAVIGEHILGPVAQSVLLCGTGIEVLYGLAQGDEHNIHVHHSLGNFPGRGGSGPRH